MKKNGNARGQMSEAMSTGIFLTLSGGFQDAYTYYCRGKVFANAQTGNIVLMGSHLAAGEWSLGLRYLSSLLAFAAGVYVAEHVKRLHKQDRQLHWRQLVLAMEIFLLLLVGFMPQSMNTAANIVVSFVCALQVDTFRKIKGSPYATTMCIGNLRSATECLYQYRHTGNKELMERCVRYYGVIGIFAVGAVMGGVLTAHMAEKTIWISCGLLMVSFLIMFIKEEEEKLEEREESEERKKAGKPEGHDR